MDTKRIRWVVACLEEVEDPRRDHLRLHRLSDVLALVLLATMAGADAVVEIEEFGLDREEWLRQFLELPNGIPSHDTIGRVLRLLKPSALDEALKRIHSELSGLAAGMRAAGGHVAIDGKAVRRSFDQGDRNSALHLVQAWCCQNRMVVEQLPVEGKANEITVIPALLSRLDLRGQTVTIDAIGCQRLIAESIVEGKGDYILQVKGNQPALHDEMVAFHAHAVASPTATFEHRPVTAYTTTSVDKDHGRIETRDVWTCGELDWFADKPKWRGLRTLVVQRSVRETNDKRTDESRIFITSIPADQVERIATTIREHWSIENELHWVLDMVFREDESRSRRDHVAENLALVRRFALALFKRDKGSRGSMRVKRKRAGWKLDYLIDVLALPAE